MKYVFCTIAYGKKYYDLACNFSTKLNAVSKTHKVLIVTDCGSKNIENVTFLKLNESEKKIIKGWFNFNLKYIPIMESIKLDYKFIIFFDADWQIHNGYDENKLINLLNDLDKKNIDFVYERPHSIGDNKRKLDTCFWEHKIKYYNLLKTNFYDNGQVVNEQFMIFRNSEKLKIFVDKWKERNEFGVKNDIWAFAEGLEIGMSSVDAKLNMDWKLMLNLKNFFSFVDRTGGLNIRY